MHTSVHPGHCAQLGYQAALNQTMALTNDQINKLWQLDQAIVAKMATDPSTPASLLERLATHPLSAVRGALCENENTPISTIWVLAKDQDPDVRYQLAENYSLPLGLLRALTDDENPYVAYRAQRTFDRLKAS